MAESKTSIANLALSHLNVGKSIADIDNERSAEAQSLRRFYDIALDNVLEEFEWPFATKQADLALIETDPDGEEWKYVYQYPSDALHLRRILGLSRQHSLPHDGLVTDGRISYKVAQLGDKKVVYTDQKEARMEYTRRETDPALYTSTFTIAFSYWLAFLAAPRILDGAKAAKITDDLFAKYQRALNKAMAHASKEGKPDLTAESEFSSSRD